MQQKFYQGLYPNGFHRLAYTEWNANNKKRTIICVHGFTRNSRDFDFLAKELEKTYRVICPDVAGHGLSSWLSDAKYYTFPQIFSDMSTLISRLDVDEVDWVGSSLGGRAGLYLASLPETPIRKLILNDIGPIWDPAAFRDRPVPVVKTRIFANLDEVDSYFRKIYAAMGSLSDKHWQHLVKHSVVLEPEGFYRLAYDPKFITGPPYQVSNKARLTRWKQIKCPIYLIHGNESKVLTPLVLKEMLKLQPTMKVCGIPEVGHTPSIMEAHQIETIRGWLAE